MVDYTCHALGCLCSVVWSVETYALQKLEEQDRKALNTKEQLQREHRYLKRRLEQLSVQGLERIRTDSMGSTISTDSEQGTAQLKKYYMLIFTYNKTLKN